MRICVTEEFRFPANLRAATSAFYQPGDYDVKPNPQAGEFAVTQEVADAALAAGKATAITVAVQDEAAEG